MAKTLIEQLEHTRKGYLEECIWHRFLLDAYLATGGFAGKVRQPLSGPWGAAAEMYSTFVSGSYRGTVEVDTYLDAYPREELAKFRQRVDGVEYHNYVEAITDLKIGHINRREFVPVGRPERVAKWRENVDGNGTAWEELRPQHVLLAGILGWRPVLIDARPVDTDEKGAPLVTNAAQARELRLQPYPVPLFPANILDYGVDDAGQLRYAKIKTTEVRQELWDSEAEEVATYTIWTPTEWLKYEVRGENKDVREVGRGANPFNAVPLVIYQHKPSPQEPIIGCSMNGAISNVARAHLNRLSEFNEHMRGQVFALLVLSTKEGTQEKPDETVGVYNGLPIDQDARQPHAYIAPPASVAATYEKRLEAQVCEMYRVARVEYTRATGNVSSGEAHAYEFAATNNALSDFAVHIAKAEEHVDWLVGRYYGVDEALLRASRVLPPTSFDVENLTVEIKAAFDLISGGVGPTATNLLKMKAIRQVLKNLDHATVAVIESELAAELQQQAADQAAAEEAAMAAAEALALAAEDDDDNEDEPDDELNPEA